jgi:hypothetical protein
MDEIWFRVPDAAIATLDHVVLAKYRPDLLPANVAGARAPAPALAPMPRPKASAPPMPQR